jgi:hypothetical protein
MAPTAFQGNVCWKTMVAVGLLALISVRNHGSHRARFDSLGTVRTDRSNESDVFGTREGVRHVYLSGVHYHLLAFHSAFSFDFSPSHHAPFSLRIHLPVGVPPNPRWSRPAWSRTRPSDPARGSRPPTQLDLARISPFFLDLKALRAFAQLFHSSHTDPHCHLHT